MGPILQIHIPREITGIHGVRGSHGNSRVPWDVLGSYREHHRSYSQEVLGLFQGLIPAKRYILFGCQRPTAPGKGFAPPYILVQRIPVHTNSTNGHADNISANQHSPFWANHLATFNGLIANRLASFPTNQHLACSYMDQLHHSSYVMSHCWFLMVSLCTLPPGDLSKSMP